MTKAPEDKATYLVQQVLINRDQNAFAILVNQYQSQVRAFLRKLTMPDNDLADDLAQETFLKAYQHLSSFQGSGRFLGWLFKIAYQQFVQHYRKYKNIQEVEYDHINEAVIADSEESKLTVNQLIRYLPVKERAVIILHYQYGMTHSEVADNLNIPLGTVKTSIRSAKQTMLNVQQGVMS